MPAPDHFVLAAYTRRSYGVLAVGALIIAVAVTGAAMVDGGSPVTHLLARLAFPILGGVILVGLMLFLVVPIRKIGDGVPQLLLRKSAFVVPAGSRFVWYPISFWASQTPFLIPMIVDAWTDPLRVGRAVAVVFLGLSAMVVAFTVIVSRAGASYAALTPDGLHVPVSFGSYFVPWTALAPGGPLHQPIRGAYDRQVTIFIADPAACTRRGLSRPAPPQWLKFWSTPTHPWFLADAIRHYVENPEHRSAIGTPEEYQRLRTVLNVPITPAERRYLNLPGPSVAVLAR